MALTDENGFWNNKYASINTLVVSHKDNVLCKCKTYSKFYVDSSIELTLPQLVYHSPW